MTSIALFYCLNRISWFFFFKFYRPFSAIIGKQTVIGYELSERILSPYDYTMKQTIVRFLISRVCVCVNVCVRGSVRSRNARNR